MSLYWIDREGPGRVAIMARPRSGDWLADEVAAWRAAGVNIVVSLLESDEIEDLGLEAEPDLCAHEGLGFRKFPIPDRGIPSLADAARLARSLAAEVNQGRAVAIHCRAGIGRSSVVAALVLIALGDEATEIFHRISTARRLEVPDTPEQRAWVLSIADEVAAPQGHSE